MNMTNMTRKLVALSVLAIGCHTAKTGEPSGAKGVAPVSFSLSSAGFNSGSSMPPQYTCDGVDQSPELTWDKVPDGTRSLALLVDDPDAPNGTFTHWIVWNMKPESRMLGANSNGGLLGGSNGTNDFDRVGYSGPCPPKGQPHHYHFKLYALDAMLTLKQSAKRAELLSAMDGHVVGLAELVATFEH